MGEGMRSYPVDRRKIRESMRRIELNVVNSREALRVHRKIHKENKLDNEELADGDVNESNGAPLNSTTGDAFRGKTAEAYFDRLCESITNYYILSDDEWLRRYWHSVCIDIHYVLPHGHHNDDDHEKIKEIYENTVKNEIERISTTLDTLKLELMTKGLIDAEIVLIKEYLRLSQQFIQTTERRISAQNVLNFWVFEDVSMLEIAAQEYYEKISKSMHKVMDSPRLAEIFSNACKLDNHSLFEQTVSFLADIESFEGQIWELLPGAKPTFLSTFAYFSKLFKLQFTEVVKAYLDFNPKTPEESLDWQERWLELYNYGLQIVKYLEHVCFQHRPAVTQQMIVSILFTSVESVFIEVFASEMLCRSDQKPHELNLFARTAIEHINQIELASSLFTAFVSKLIQDNDERSELTNKLRIYIFSCLHFAEQFPNAQSEEHFNKKRGNISTEFKAKHPIFFRISAESLFKTLSPHVLASLIIRETLKAATTSTNAKTGTNRVNFLLPYFEFIDTPYAQNHHVVLQSACEIILPSSMGGLAPTIEQKAYYYNLQLAFHNLSQDFQDLLPLAVVDGMIDQILKVRDTEKQVVLKWGDWLCVEDPSVEGELPVELSRFVDVKDLRTSSEVSPEISGLTSSNLEKGAKWHSGWSVVNTTWNSKPMQCSLVQYRILNRLRKSDEPLSADKLLPEVDDEEYIEVILHDLVAQGMVHQVGELYALTGHTAPSSLIRQLHFVNA